MNTLNTVENMKKVYHEIKELTKNNIEKPEIVVYETKIDTPIHNTTPEMVLRTSRGTFWVGYPNWNKEYNGKKLYVGLAVW